MGFFKNAGEMALGLGKIAGKAAGKAVVATGKFAIEKGQEFAEEERRAAEKAAMMSDRRLVEYANSAHRLAEKVAYRKEAEARGFIIDKNGKVISNW